MGRDVDDVLGFGIRGQWSHEGKLLVLLNGMQLNDASYGICAMGGRIQLDNVARIEVINGPGSVIYGGFAEMGVVNIITKGVEEQTGLVASTSLGFGSNGRDMTSVQVGGANRVGTGTGLDYAAGVSQGTPFTPMYGTPGGATLNYADSANVETVSGYFRLRKRGFRGQFLANDQFRQVSDQEYDVTMRTLIGQADMRLLHTKWSNLDVTGMYRLQLPWAYTGLVDGELYATNTRDQRYMVQSVFRTYIAGKVGLVAGFNGYMDHFEHIGTGPDAVFTINGKRNINVGDGALFAELFLKGGWGNFRIGGRAEQNGLSGLSTAPRFAYTGVFGSWHFKVLYSQAFRLPALQNANTALPEVGIRPERAITQELQLGRSIGSHTDVLLTAFHTALVDPIVYVYLGDIGIQDSYVNRSASTTQGLEAQLQHTGERWRTTASFSMYQAIASSSDLPEVQLDDAHDGSFAALPNMKGVVTASIRTRGHLWLGGNAIWQSASYGWTTIASEESVASEVVSYAPTLRSGVFATWRARNTTGLSLTAGVDDIFDQGWTIASPYNNGLATLPTGGRTLRLRAEIRFGL